MWQHKSWATKVSHQVHRDSSDTIILAELKLLLFQVYVLTETTDEGGEGTLVPDNKLKEKPHTKTWKFKPQLKI